jgi:hypothetical protein
MKQIFLFALMTFFVQTTFCQNLSDTVNVEYSKNSPKRWSTTTGVFTSALALHSFPNLNHFLESQRVVEDNLSNVIPYIPFGTRFQNKRFQAQATFGFGVPTSRDNLNVRTFSIQTGYAFLADRNSFFYLNLGAGFSDYIKTINISTSQPTTLASAIQSGTGQSIALTNSQAYIDINIEFLNRAKGKNIGNCIRLGYRYGLKDKQWETPFIKSRLSDLPSDKISSVYLEGLINIPNVRNKRQAAQNDDYR